jgi:hypothetical protein
LKALAVLAGREAEVFLERAGEVLGIIEAEKVGDSVISVIITSALPSATCEGISSIF